MKRQQRRPLEALALAAQGGASSAAGEAALEAPEEKVVYMQGHQPPRGPRRDAPASCQEEAPRSPDSRGQPEEGAAPAAAVPRGQQPPQARGPRALLRGRHPGGEWESGHPDADHLAYHPRSRRRVGQEQPGRSAAPSSPRPGSEPGTSGDTLPLPSAWA